MCPFMGAFRVMDGCRISVNHRQLAWGSLRKFTLIYANFPLIYANLRGEAWGKGSGHSSARLISKLNDVIINVKLIN